MITATSQEARISSLCADAHWNTLVYIVLPARLGPGSRGMVPETVSGWLLGRLLEAATMSRSQEGEIDTLYNSWWMFMFRI